MRIKEEPQEEEEDEEEEAQAEEAQTQAQVKQEDEQHAENEVKQEDENQPNSPPSQLQEKDSEPIDSLEEPPNQPGDLAPLCRTPDSGVTPIAVATASASSPTRSTSKPTVLCSTPADAVPLIAQFGAPPPPHFSVPLSLQHHQHLLANDQLLRVLTERSGHWFSLLPRSPCDDSSLVQPATPPRSSAQSNSVRPRSPPALSCSPQQHLQPPSASSSPLNAAHDSLGTLTISPLQVSPSRLCIYAYRMKFPSLPTMHLNYPLIVTE